MATALLALSGAAATAPGLTSDDAELVAIGGEAEPLVNAYVPMLAT